MAIAKISRFDDETILNLFGAQAAEDDRPDQLKSYLFETMLLRELLPKFL